jgi:hypothetical protein
MNDLETRLRDALDAAARTVPDHATGPGLEPDDHSSRHRMLVAFAAAAAVVAAIAIPLGIRAVSTDRTAAPACPAPVTTGPATLPSSPSGEPVEGWSDTLPAGAPPRVPFTVDGPDGYLQDGTVRVPLEAGKDVYPIARLDCGWLVRRSVAGRHDGNEIGVLLPDGRFAARAIGTDVAAVSPDRTQVAVGAADRTMVLDVESGREVASTPVPHGALPGFWTADGIWIGYGREATRLLLWQPGSPLREVRWVGGDVFPIRSGRLLIAPEDRPCVKVLALTPANALETVMQRCAEHLNGGSLSPDGRILVTRDGRAYRVPQNTSTRLNAPRNLWLGADSFGAGVWEDDTHLLLEAAIGENNATGRQVVIRCDAVNGRCERLYDADRSREIHLPDL